MILKKYYRVFEQGDGGRVTGYKPGVIYDDTLLDYYDNYLKSSGGNKKRKSRKNKYNNTQASYIRELE